MTDTPLEPGEELEEEGIVIPDDDEVPVGDLPEPEGSEQDDGKDDVWPEDEPTDSR